MSLDEDKVIGIVGGMGPQAGADLLDRISRATHATKDQQHRSVVLMSFPRYIADRTAFVEGEVDENPGFSIAEVIGRLENAGARVIGIACNSSHIPAIYDTIVDELHRMKSGVKLLHMPFETCRFLKNSYPHAVRVGLLATNGTYRSGIYQDMLKQLNLEPVVPDPEFQDKVIHRIIYDPQFGIKACPGHITNEVRTLINEALDFFEAQRTDLIILGCTEFSLLFKDDSVRNVLVVNSNDALARALVAETE